MSTNILYNEFGIRGYRFESAIRSEGTTMYVLSQERHRLRCPRCGTPDVERRGDVTRVFSRCDIIRQVKVAFADEHRRYARSFERYVLELSRSMTNLTVPTPQALMTMGRPVIVPEIIADDGDSEQALSPRTYRHVDDDKPVELKLGDLAGIKVDVDRPTRNAMATTFLGAILVALGAILFSMLGGKSKA